MEAAAHRTPHWSILAAGRAARGGRSPRPSDRRLRPVPRPPGPDTMCRRGSRTTPGRRRGGTGAAIGGPSSGIAGGRSRGNNPGPGRVPPRSIASSRQAASACRGDDARSGGPPRPATQRHPRTQRAGRGSPQPLAFPRPRKVAGERERKLAIQQLMSRGAFPHRQISGGFERFQEPIQQPEPRIAAHHRGQPRQRLTPCQALECPRGSKGRARAAFSQSSSRPAMATVAVPPPRPDANTSHGRCEAPERAGGFGNPHASEPPNGPARRCVNTERFASHLTRLADCSL